VVLLCPCAFVPSWVCVLWLVQACLSLHQLEAQVSRLRMSLWLMSGRARRHHFFISSFLHFQSNYLTSTTAKFTHVTMARLSESLKLLAAVGTLVACGTRADWCTEDQESFAIDYTMANADMIDACFTFDTATLAIVEYLCESECTALYYGMMTSISDCEVTTTGMNWYQTADEVWNACGSATSTSASA
jgi:hypothetical protein